MIFRLLGASRGSGWMGVTALAVVSGCAGTDAREYAPVDPSATATVTGSSTTTAKPSSSLDDVPDTGGALPDGGETPEASVDGQASDSGVNPVAEDAGDSGVDTDTGASAAETDADAATSQPVVSDAGADSAISPASTLAPAVSSAVAAGPDASTACLPVVQEVTDEGANHTDEGTAVTYINNPPASGTHYGRAANYHAYTEAVPRPYWVHNLEHGAVVFLVGPTATEEQANAMLAAFDQVADPGCTSISSPPRRVLTPDPLLTTAVAVVAWNYTLVADCVNPAAIQTFVNQHIGGGPEGLICNGGGYEP